MVCEARGSGTPLSLPLLRGEIAANTPFFSLGYALYQMLHGYAGGLLKTQKKPLQIFPHKIEKQKPLKSNLTSSSKNIRKGLVQLGASKTRTKQIRKSCFLFGFSFGKLKRQNKIYRLGNLDEVLKKLQTNSKVT